MKKNALKTFACASVFTVVLIMMMAFTQAEANAGTWYFNDANGNRIPEGVQMNVFWGTTTDYDCVTYYELKPSKTGYVTFSILSSGYSGYASLCDSNLKVISKGTYNTDGDYIYGGSSYKYQRSISYGVKKGKTYYLKLDGYSSQKNSAGYCFATIKWTNGKVKASKYGKKKSKAKAIKKNKTVKGLFVAGNKKGQWFKITNKQKKTKITIKSSKNNERFKVIAYYKSFNKWYKDTSYVTRSTGKDVLTGTISRKVKHTYYIKVVPDGKSSGYYTIKWK